MKKIICVVGARPQFVKHAPLEIELKKYFKVETLHTGQHFDEQMSQVFFDQLGLEKPKYMLDISGGDHGAMTARMMLEMEPLFKMSNPDAVLIYGDTNSTLAGALVAAKLNIPVIHVEAGLRSYNRTMPEEVNRIVADHLSQILLAPTDTAIENLKKEGFESGVFRSGDVMLDTLRIMSARKSDPEKDYSQVLMTLHRPYNVDDPNRLLLILNSIDKLGMSVLFPAHPRTASKLKELQVSFENISVVDPMGYVDIIDQLSNANVLITDSGGMQKEAYFLKRKCITIRSETEWLETLKGGWNTLVWSENELGQLAEIIDIIPIGYQENLYGNGHAAQEIAEIIMGELKNS